jgi:putative transposase
LIGDKAYGAADVHDFLTLQGCEAVIPPKAGCRNPRPFDPVRYKSRNIIERSFNRLKDWRGIATRYDKVATSSPASASLLPSPTGLDESTP